MKTEFFTAIAAIELLKDGDSLDVKIQRTGDEFTLLVVPHVSKKTADLVMSGTPEELDEHFITELQKPFAKSPGLKSNADSVDLEEEEENEEEESGASKKALPKKAVDTSKNKNNSKKAAPKKATVAKKDDKPEEEEEEEEKESEEDKAKREAEEQADAERIAQEEADQKAEAEKLEAEKKAAEEKAAAEVEAKLSKARFKKAMELGEKAFTDRKYEESEVYYQYASELNPNDEKAKEVYNKSKSWVDRLIEGKVLDGRILDSEKLREEVNNGI